MRYVLGLERSGDGKIPARVEVRDTDHQHGVVTSHAMPKQQTIEREYTPTGILSLKDKLLVGTKFGLVQFQNKKLVQFPSLVEGSKPLDALVAQYAKDTVPDDGSCSCTFAVADGITYWLPTLHVGIGKGQKAVGLFQLAGTTLERLAGKENVVGPLLSFGDALVYYVERDSLPTQRRGVLYSYTRSAFHVSRREADLFSSELFRQPVALCTDGEDIYSASTQDTEAEISQFSPTLALKKQTRVSLDEIADVTAFAVFKVSYVRPEIPGMPGVQFSVHPEKTYALIGGSTGNLALVDMETSHLVAKLNIRDNELKEHIGERQYVKNILVAQKAEDDAQVLVQYSNATVFMRASELLTTAFYLSSHGDPSALLVASGYTQNFKNNPRVAYFPTSITCSGVVP
jgi:hypothetical protein